MFAQNTVKIVGCQHLKTCKGNVRNTEVFLGRIRQASRGDWLEIIGTLSLAMMEDAHLSGSELEFWVQAFVGHSHLATSYVWAARQVFSVILSYPNLSSFHEPYSTP